MTILHCAVKSMITASMASIFFVVGLLAGAPAALAQTQTAVEYYYADWNFYFVTSFPDEIAALDGGVFGAVWKRTGQTFNVWTGPTNGALPTCRFFSVIFAPRSSHFYTPYGEECASLKAGNAWQYEAIAFYLVLPNANGNCPPGTAILYRLYNNGMGGAPNHRFTTNLATFNEMQSLGWTFEGNGLTGAFACVPQSASPPASAEGIWAGATTTGELFFGFVLDDGTFYFIYAGRSNADLLQGVATSRDGQFTSSSALDVNFAGMGVTNATISGAYVPQTSFNGMVNSGFGATIFGATYSAAYEQPANLSSAAGTFSGVAGTSTSQANVTITLSAAGAIFGTTTDGCSFTGTALPRGNVNVFNLSVTFGGGACAFGTNTVAGIFYYDAPTAEFIVAAPNAARTDGFFTIGTKQ